MDVRTPAEYEEIHIPGSVLHPLSDLNASAIASAAQGKQRCILVCRSGNRARQAADKLKTAGLPSLEVLEGGVTAWESSGKPVLRGRKTISLERQVRIAAGSLVVLGLLLGWLVNPGFIAISAFVGCGLIFAGITDWCGMALLIAKAPWNQRAGIRCHGTSCSLPQ